MQKTCLLFMVALGIFTQGSNRIDTTTNAYIVDDMNLESSLIEDEFVYVDPSPANSGPANATSDKFLIYNFTKLVSIDSISLRGNRSSDQFVSSFKISVSLDGVNFFAINAGKIYNGNSNSRTLTTVKFVEGVIAKIIRIEPLTFINGLSSTWKFSYLELVIPVVKPQPGASSNSTQNSTQINSSFVSDNNGGYLLSTTVNTTENPNIEERTKDYETYDYDVNSKTTYMRIKNANGNTQLSLGEKLLSSGFNFTSFVDGLQGKFKNDGILSSIYNVHPEGFSKFLSSEFYLLLTGLGPVEKRYNSTYLFVLVAGYFYPLYIVQRVLLMIALQLVENNVSLEYSKSFMARVVAAVNLSETIEG